MSALQRVSGRDRNTAHRYRQRPEDSPTCKDRSRRGLAARIAETLKGKAA